MEKIAALFALLVLTFAVGCAAPADEDDTATVQQAGMVAKLPTCKVTERDYEDRPNFCEGKLSIVPSEWSDSDLATIEAAMQNWNALIGSEYFQLSLVESAQETCHISKGPRPDKVLATWKGTQNMIVDREKIAASAHSEERFQTTLQHEMGHSIGLRHRESGVMCSSAWVTSEFNARDQEQCREAGLCK